MNTSSSSIVTESTGASASPADELAMLAQLPGVANAKQNSVTTSHYSTFNLPGQDTRVIGFGQLAAAFIVGGDVVNGVGIAASQVVTNGDFMLAGENFEHVAIAKLREAAAATQSDIFAEWPYTWPTHRWTRAYRGVLEAGRPFAGVTRSELDMQMDFQTALAVLPPDGKGVNGIRDFNYGFYLLPSSQARAGGTFRGWDAVNRRMVEGLIPVPAPTALESGIFTAAKITYPWLGSDATSGVKAVLARVQGYLTRLGAKEGDVIMLGFPAHRGQTLPAFAQEELFLDAAPEKFISTVVGNGAKAFNNINANTMRELGRLSTGPLVAATRSSTLQTSMRNFLPRGYQHAAPAPIVKAPAPVKAAEPVVPAMEDWMIRDASGQAAKVRDLQAQPAGTMFEAVEVFTAPGAEPKALWQVADMSGWGFWALAPDSDNPGTHKAHSELRTLEELKLACAAPVEAPSHLCPCSHSAATGVTTYPLGQGYYPIAFFGLGGDAAL